MMTPDTEAGRITNEIMVEIKTSRMKHNLSEMQTDEYNRTWEAVFRVLDSYEFDEEQALAQSR